MSKEVKLNKEEKPLKSQLLEESKSLNERLDVLVKEMQEREYEIDFQNVRVFNHLLKFLEKNAPWGHTTATGLIMLYTNLKQQKAVIKSLQDKWDGKVAVRAANVQIFWTMVTKMSGNGFYEAKNFVELMAAVGESLSKAVQQVNIDNTDLRETHAKVNDIESILSNPERYIDDVEVEAVEEKSLADEVDPVVEG